MAKILLLNGPNLNLLGTREPDKYGQMTLAQVEKNLTALAQSLTHELQTAQSNCEAKLIEFIQQSKAKDVRFVIINPAALTHTSIALRDAFLAVDIPFIEIHISNVFARESFRHQSYLCDIAVGVISGLGTKGYELALIAADHYLKHKL